MCTFYRTYLCQINTFRSPCHHRHSYSLYALGWPDNFLNVGYILVSHYHLRDSPHAFDNQTTKAIHPLDSSAIPIKISYLKSVAQSGWPNRERRQPTFGPDQARTHPSDPRSDSKHRDYLCNYHIWMVVGTGSISARLINFDKKSSTGFHKGISILQPIFSITLPFLCCHVSQALASCSLHQFDLPTLSLNSATASSTLRERARQSQADRAIYLPVRVSTRSAHSSSSLDLAVKETTFCWYRHLHSTPRPLGSPLGGETT